VQQHHVRKGHQGQCATYGSGVRYLSLQACVCRLAVVATRMKALEEIDVSHNRLESLPASLLGGKHVRVVDASCNELRPEGIPWHVVAHSESLQELLLHENPALGPHELDLEALAQCRALSRVTVSGQGHADVQSALNRLRGWNSPVRIER
jgi:hypothetical protein